MKIKIFILLIFFFYSLDGKCQISYSGKLGKHPISLVLYFMGNDATTYYVYNKFDTPIAINGHLKEGKLELFELDLKRNITATLVFSKFKESDSIIKGNWRNADGTKEHKIVLKKDFEINYGDDIEWKATKELIQPESSKNHYFKTIITKEKGRFNARVSGVKIFEKNTDKLIQKIELDCDLHSLGNIIVDDYNFDGLQDFSVFESFYTGTNTSSIYILKKPNSEKYFVSDFEGTSLEFDKEKKLIYSRNVSRGSFQRLSTYKIKNNKMILIKEVCYDYDREQQDYVKVKCE